MGEKIIQDFVKSIFEYNPRIKSNSHLRDDFKLLAAYYSSKKAGNNIVIGNTTVSVKDIVSTARLIYNEVEDRKSGGTMEHEWNPDSMKPAARELFDNLSEPESQVLASHITEDIIIIKNAIYLSSPSSTEVILNLEDNSLSKIVKSKLYKMFPDEIAQKLNILNSNISPQNITPLFDLVLKRRVDSPKQTGVKLMAALTPANTKKIFYSMPDLMEVCFI